MNTYVMQVRFPLRPGSMSYSALASVRRMVAESESEADQILRAEYRRRGVHVHSIRSFGKV